MRYAKQVWDAYKNNQYVQDVAETLIGSGISAGGQLLFTDMDANDVLASTAIGAGLALGARPLGARGGRFIGRQIDKSAPGLFDGIKKYVPVTEEGISTMKRNLEGAPENVRNSIIEMLEAKRNYHSIKPDGTNRGVAETILSYYGNTRADNLAQYGFALASPFIFGNSGSEVDETGQSYIS